MLHLLYGNDEVRLNDARYELVASLLPPEERAGNLTEMRGAPSSPLRLERTLNEITAELGMLALIPGSPRVLVIHDLADFYDASRGRKAAAPKRAAKAAPAADPIESLGTFITTTLRESGNIAVFVCAEDDEKGRTVDENSPLYRLVTRHGTARCFRTKPIIWEFEAALYEGDTVAALRTLREWKQRAGSDSGARLRIYKSIAGFIELLLQARSAREARERGIPPSTVLPPTLHPSVTRLPDFRKRQLDVIAQRTPVARLRTLVARADRIQRLMYPRGTEPFVADWYELAEQTVVEMLAPS